MFIFDINAYVCIRLISQYIYIIYYIYVCIHSRAISVYNQEIGHWLERLVVYLRNPLGNDCWADSQTTVTTETHR